MYQPGYQPKAVRIGPEPLGEGPIPAEGWYPGWYIDTQLLFYVLTTYNTISFFLLQSVRSNLDDFLSHN